MSELGLSRRFPDVRVMSVDPDSDQIADIAELLFCAIRDNSHCSKRRLLFDHFVGAGEQCGPPEDLGRNIYLVFARLAQHVQAQTLPFCLHTFQQLASVVVLTARQERRLDGLGQVAKTSLGVGKYSAKPIAKRKLKASRSLITVVHGAESIP